MTSKTLKSVKASVTAPKVYIADPGKPPYKSSTGRYRTESLFYETHKNRYKDGYPPVFTLKEADFKGYPSIRRMYLEISDPTEHFFAKTVLGSWDHWQRLLTLSWFKPHIKSWREELELQLKAMGIQELKNNASLKNDAAKYFANEGWKSQRGRPSKEELERRLEDELSEKSEMDDDASRLGL